MFSETIKDAPANPEVVDEPKPAAAEVEQTTDAPEAEKKESVVPYGAMHEERMRRKQAEERERAKDQQLQQLIQSQAQRDQEYRVAQERLQQILAKQNPPPDENADPLAFTVHTAKQTQAQVEQLRREQQWAAQQQEQVRLQQEQAQRQQQQVQQLMQLTTQAEESFAKVTPDYQDAVQFIKAERAKELVAIGWPVEEAAKGVEREGWQLAHQWLSQGMNPAQMAYQLAKAKGWQGNVSAEQKLQMQEAGQRAAKPTGGGTTKGKLTMAALASMTPSQLAGLSEADFKAVAGG